MLLNGFFSKLFKVLTYFLTLFWIDDDKIQLERESFSIIADRVIEMFGSLKAGDKGRIIDVSNVGKLVQRRLLDLGITEGTEVCVKCFMPFGGPVMIESCGQCIGIRRKEAIQIEVERL